MLGEGEEDEDEAEGDAHTAQDPLILHADCGSSGLPEVSGLPVHCLETPCRLAPAGHLILPLSEHQLFSTNIFTICLHSAGEYSFAI